jgi:hypothetical protein
MAQWPEGTHGPAQGGGGIYCTPCRMYCGGADANGDEMTCACCGAREAEELLHRTDVIPVLQITPDACQAAQEVPETLPGPAEPDSFETDPAPGYAKPEHAYGTREPMA